MKRVGIVGFGSFGKFLAEKLGPYAQVLVYSPSGKLSQWASDLDQVAKTDYLIFAIPLDSYPVMLERVKPLILAETTIVDVCSVKEEPVAIIRSILPNHKLVATHPLFGPESADDSLAGHVLVLCPDVSDERALKEVEKFALDLQLKVEIMSAREHDQEMATVQGLTFFIAHILKDCHIHNLRLNTPSFKRLLHLAQLEQHHSDDLFITIQTGNQQTKTVRNQFISIATKLNDKLNNHSR